MVVSILEFYCFLQLGEIIILVLIWPWLCFKGCKTSSQAGFIHLLALARVPPREENRLSTHLLKQADKEGERAPWATQGVKLARNKTNLKSNSCLVKLAQVITFRFLFISKIRSVNHRCYSVKPLLSLQLRQYFLLP